MYTFGFDLLNQNMTLGLHSLNVTLGLHLLNWYKSFGLLSLREGGPWIDPRVL